MPTSCTRAGIAALALSFLLATVVAAPANAATPDPFGAGWFVDPDSHAAREADALRDDDPERAALFDRIATRPQADWYGDWIATGDVDDAVARRTARIRDADATPVFVLYAIPLRDCGSYSAGGVDSPAAYRDWVDAVARGLDGGPAAVVVEPDALAGLDCLTPAQQDDRVALLAYAVDRLGAAGASVYLDAGHSGWHTAATMAGRLRAAGIARARGFALNVSNVRWTDTEVAYARDLSARLGGAHAVIDTSRNGRGPAPDGQWCNPDGRGLGPSPTTVTADPVVDAYLWVKRPGESDGTCNGGPAAGTWWPAYAEGLAARAVEEAAPTPEPDPAPAPESDPEPAPAPDPTSPPALPARVAGPDRVATAIAAADLGWAGARHVVLARSDDPADALAGTALAGHLGAPLLVTPPDRLDPRVGEAVTRLGAREVVVLGGPGAIDPSVTEAVARTTGASVRRVAGDTRTDTAVAVAERLGGTAGTALLVHERAWADALAASGLAARRAAAGDPWPVLLAGDEVPDATWSALDRLDVDRVLVVGGHAVLDPAIDDALERGGYRVDRLAGTTRHGTSVAAATQDLGLHGGGPLLLATSAGFADGLAAGALAARTGGVLLLAPPEVADEGQRDWARTHHDALVGVTAVGGPAALSDLSRGALAEAVVADG